MPRRGEKPPGGKAAPPRVEEIIPIPMEDMMHNSMIPYSEYVIMERALPRVEDGLKPVQRRILFTMLELALSPDKPHRKCARIVGDCLGKYHPHGDSSVYDSLVRLAQPFSMRAPLVDGHGNFGSIDGDSAAAMRYTEARLTPLTMELLRDIDKDTVPFRLNFDDTQKEPDMLPGRFPNLLVNGASGIAVGLATNIPPHNLRETIDAALLMIDSPDVPLERLTRHMPAPDFPTGGLLVRDEELARAYETGRGKLRLKARVHIEEGPQGRKLIVMTEVPYQVSKAALLEKILRLSEERKEQLSGIHDIRDESDRAGMRAVIELKRDVDPQKVLKVLYKYSDLQVTFGVNMVAIAQGKPMLLGLKAMLEYYIAHQRAVLTRRTGYELDEAKRREHILKGLMIAVDNLDEVIARIRASKTPKEARGALCERFSLTEIQAQAILDMRLQRLTGLEILELRKEYEAILALIKQLEAILHSPRRLDKLLIAELTAIRDKYSDPRRTELIDEAGEPEDAGEEAPPAEDTVVVMTRAGFLKRLSPKAYERSTQGESEPEPLSYVFQTTTAGRLLCFTGKGNCFPLIAGNVPECRLRDRGMPPTGLLSGLDEGESVIAMVPGDTPGAGELLFVTKRGMVKRTAIDEYAVRKAKFAAINLKANDQLLDAQLARPDEEGAVLLISRGAMSILFAGGDIPLMGRTTSGVKGMALDIHDQVARMIQTGGEGEVVLVSDRGYMKRCLMVDFDPQGRGGKGARCFAFQKNGANGQHLAGALPVTDPVDFVVAQKGGQITRMNSDDVQIEPKASRGKPYYVIVMMDDVVEGVFCEN